MTPAFSTFGSPIGYSQPYGAQGFGISPWQQQMPQQSLQFVPQQLQPVQYLQLQQQLLQQLQQLLQVIPQQLHQLQHVIQSVPQQLQQLQQLQQQLQSQQSPFGQTAAGIGGGFSSPFLGTPLFGPQSFPSHVM